MKLVRSFGRKLKPFNANASGLREDFSLTDYSKRLGTRCKVEETRLFGFLDSLGNRIMTDSPDCSFDRLTKDLALVTTIDFFYPIVNDPYEQGRIGAANVLSNLYASGVTEMRNGLMVLAVSTQMDSDEQQIITKAMIKGYADTFKEAGAEVTGGQTVFNDSPIIGGAAIGVARGQTPYTPRNAKPGDVLVLSKPLGTHIIANAYENKNQIGKTGLNETELSDLYLRATEYMGRLNRTASLAMLEHGATSSTDIAGFGLLSHAQNLASIQIENVDFRIDSLPSFQGVNELGDLIEGLRTGSEFSSETSGGLLISLPETTVENFIQTLQEQGENAWVVGRVEPGKRQASLSSEIELIEV